VAKGLIGPSGFEPDGPGGTGPTHAYKIPLFGHWLEETKKLQVEAYGRVPNDASDVQSWLTYIREQTLAAFVEMGEFLTCFKWKPWAAEPRIPTFGERAEAIEEAVDVLHFVANGLAALGVTDQELDRAYIRKMQKNRARMESGGHRT
jgi:dimeric dUTPase (all-alpha-NTP-PPase superfamily)